MLVAEICCLCARELRLVREGASVDFSFFTSLPIWVKWFLLALAFFFIELLHTAWVLVWFGFAALGAMMVAVFFPDQVVIQMAIFFILTTASIAVYFMFFKPPPPPPPHPPGVGKEVLSVEKIDNHSFTGAIHYGGRAWNARSYDDNVVIEPGQRTLIIDWEINKAVVKPIPKRKVAAQEGSDGNPG